MPARRSQQHRDLHRSLIRIARCVAPMALACPLLLSQQNTDSTCHVFGHDPNCASATTDYGTPEHRDYAQDQQAPVASDAGISSAILSPSFSKALKKFCASHPAQTWQYFSKADGHVIRYGQCPATSGQAAEAVASFTARHRDYVPGQTNSDLTASYLNTHRLDPRNEKSYEIAFRDLKKTGELQIRIPSRDTGE